MNPTTTVIRCHARRFTPVLAGLIVAFIGAGCRQADPVTPAPPGGGQEYVLDYNLFVSDVAPVLTAKGCDNLACHGDGFRGTFMLSPANDKNVALDFEQSSLQVDGADPTNSALLRKPLAESAGGATHAGDSPQAAFASDTDTGYQAILSWIEAGEFR